MRITTNLQGADESLYLEFKGQFHQQHLDHSSSLLGLVRQALHEWREKNPALPNLEAPAKAPHQKRKR